MKKLTAIIINYNTADLLCECINNLLEQWPDIEIVVRDNGSPDASANVVKAEFSEEPRVRLIAGANVGIAKATNEALAQVNSEYILHVGTDAFPKKEALEFLVTYMDENSNVGICTSRLETSDGRTDWDAHRGFPTPWVALTHFSGLGKIFPKTKLFDSYFLGHLKDLREPHEIDMCISHFMLVRSKVYDQTMWDEDYFVFGEDVDICYRVKNLGWKIMYLPQVTVLHLKGVSVGRKGQEKSTASKETKKRMSEESTKAFATFYKKHLAEKYPWFISALVLLGIKVMRELRKK